MKNDPTNINNASKYRLQARIQVKRNTRKILAVGSFSYFAFFSSWNNSSHIVTLKSCCCKVSNIKSKYFHANFNPAPLLWMQFGYTFPPPFRIKSILFGLKEPQLVSAQNCWRTKGKIYKFTSFETHLSQPRRSNTLFFPHKLGDCVAGEKKLELVLTG